MGGSSKKKRAKRAAEAAAAAERAEQIQIQSQVDETGRNIGAELAAKRRVLQYGLSGERGKRGSAGLLNIARVGMDKEKTDTLG